MRPAAAIAWSGSGELTEIPELITGRLRLAQQLVASGELAAAAEHYRVLSDLVPDEPDHLARLAALYGELDQPEEEAAAWTRLAAKRPDWGQAHSRLAALHTKAGRTHEAAIHLRRLLDVYPRKTKLWIRLAALCEATGDRDGAEAAWTRVLEAFPGNLAAEEHLANLRRLKAAPAPASRSGPAVAARLTVLGNCQAFVMARCLRSLNPDLQVSAVGQPSTWEQVEGLTAKLDDMDAVLVQPIAMQQLGPLNPEDQAGWRVRTLLYPSILFTGFHPDALHASHPSRLGSLIGEWHSLLIMAGHRKGLPPHRTAELFNAYIYGVLGYFDEYAKAERFLEERAGQAGWDIAAEIQQWRGPSPFVHTPNHPNIHVMMSLARRVCRNLGLDFDKGASAPPDPFDSDWPIYPEIGKRLGVAGDLTFVSGLKDRASFDLEGAIRWFYDAYDRAPANEMAFTRVDDAIRVLAAEGVF